MDDAKQQITNQASVYGQVGINEGVINQYFGERKSDFYSSPPEHIWYVPYLRNPFFTGREELLQQLYHNLTAQKTTILTQPQAINGLGGIGKTQIAIEYAHRHRSDYHYVFWVNASTHETLTTGFMTIAKLLQLPLFQEPDQNIIIAFVKNWLDINSTWLLIMDNADDLTLLSDFLPTRNMGHILFTTREQSVHFLAQSIEIPSMNIDEGILMLLRRATILPKESMLAHVPKEEKEAAAVIVREMDGLPLALDQAAAYIEETKCGLSGYLDRYRSQRSKLLHRRGKWSKEHPEAVATTWSISFTKVEEANSTAADLLRLCAFLHPDAIPEELLTQGATKFVPSLEIFANDLMAFDETIASLRNYSLVNRYPETNTLSMHRLVQVVLRDAMSEEQQSQWATCAIRLTNQVFPSGETDTWLLCERYILHAQTCAQFIKQRKITSFEATNLLIKASNYLKERAQYSEALPLAQLALYNCEETLEPEHLLMAICLNNVALIYKFQGKYLEAEPLYQRTLNIRERVLGPDHHLVAHALNNLAELYRVQGKYSKAEVLSRQALSIIERVFGLNHLRAVVYLNNLAYYYIQNKKYTEAEPLLKQALSTYEKAFGSNHVRTATILNSLAYLYKCQDKYEEAKPFYLRALSNSEQTFGPDHPQVATALNNLAELYKVQGKHEEAEPLYQRAITIDEQMLGSNHPDTAASISNLAELYYNQSKYEQAELLYQRALHICEQALGSKHPTTLIVRENYNQLLIRMKQEN